MIDSDSPTTSQVSAGDPRFAPLVERRAARPFETIAVAGVVFAMFFAFSAIRVPVPAVNEPHFLAKAKHYWDPAWCPGDFFLDSGNAHLVFFQTVGLVAQVLPLDATAWLGRIAALALLAASWTALVRRLLPGSWSPVWAAAVFLFFASVGSLSGEWLVGGVEAKVFGYAFVFFALAAAIDRRWIAAGTWGGLAIALHPVAGMWSLLAAIFATAAKRIVTSRDRQGADAAGTLRDRPDARTLFRISVGGILLVLLALPGLWPALAMLDDGDEQIRRVAGYIQVGHRLSHHLDPMDFRLGGWIGYAGLTAVWIAGWLRGAFSAERRFFAWFTLAALLFALAGLAIGLRSEPLRQTDFDELSRLDFLRIRLLRFYPFRLYDLLAPLAAAITLVAFGDWIVRRLESKRGSSRIPRGVAAVCCGLLFATSLDLLAVDRAPSRSSSERSADWIDICRWIAEHTPSDAEFITPDPRSARRAFHWYAQRAEYVSYKNCPQDAEGIIEWNRRFRVMHRWATSHYDNQRYDAADLRALAEATGARYLLADRLGPITVEPLHSNGTYRLYRLDAALATDRAP